MILRFAVEASRIVVFVAIAHIANIWLNAASPADRETLGMIICGDRLDLVGRSDCALFALAHRLFIAVVQYR